MKSKCIFSFSTRLSELWLMSMSESIVWCNQIGTVFFRLDYVIWFCEIQNQNCPKCQISWFRPNKCKNCLSCTERNCKLHVPFIFAGLLFCKNCESTDSFEIVSAFEFEFYRSMFTAVTNYVLSTWFYNCELWAGCPNLGQGMLP